MSKKTYDFGGYATKNGIKCSDGRVILKDAFKHQDGQRVPLVWQHLHGDPSNVLGHAILENREDGVYCYGTFNNSEKGVNVKELVSHGDVISLSIYANQLQEKSKNVMHGSIREVSVVLSGANPEARIENIAFAHGEDYVEDDSEALIYMQLDLDLSHSDEEGEENSDKTLAEIFETLNEEQKTVVYGLIGQALSGEEPPNEAKHSSGEDKSVQDVFNTLSEEQKQVVYYLIGTAIEGEDKEDEEDEEGTAQHSGINYINGGNNIMKKNVFDQNNTQNENILSHDQLMDIVAGAKRYGSLKESFLAHATDYGFDPIDVLFPDAKLINQNGPELIQRDTTWVGDVLNGATHTPFARIKTVTADITADEARAKGYVTGTEKKEEIISLMKRVTTPTTVYKKQKLDRDDMIDITDFDVVIWLKREMRGMLDEELARAVLIGDGRDVSDEDKINEQCLRPIALDNDNVYVHRASVAATTKTDDVIDELIRARKHYKGSGNPTFFTSTDLLTEMLLVKDTMGRRIYTNVNELASVLRVGKIIECEIMNGAKRKISESQTNDILGVMVNMKDYTIGSDKGGQVALFDDFDIDYNQYKYLIETRVSGALTRPKSAIILEKLPAAQG